MVKLKSAIVVFFKDKRIRYLLVGGWNTIFGYLLMVILYELLSNQFHIVAIAFLSSFIAISMSFATYKVFVFNTKGFWLTEWLRSFIVYGLATLLSIFLLWLFMAIFNIDIYISQALSSTLVILGSYFGHKSFTFKKHEKKVN